jgi:hypothetical protein
VRAQRLVIVLSLAAALVAACTFANVGSVRISPEVTRQFESLQANPGYRYWYLNQENNPYGVIGVDREYAFDGGPVWREVEAGSPTFRKVVGLVESFPVPGSKAVGHTFSDHQGRTIGVWYSSLGLGVTIDPAAKTVSPSTTSPWRSPQ